MWNRPKDGFEDEGEIEGDILKRDLFTHIKDLVVFILISVRHKIHTVLHSH